MPDRIVLKVYPRFFQRLQWTSQKTEAIFSLLRLILYFVGMVDASEQIEQRLSSGAVHHKLLFGQMTFKYLVLDNLRILFK